MSATVLVQPELITWARQRVNFAEEDLARAIGVTDVATIREWEQTGTIKLSQLEKIAKKTYTPLGYLFLSSPPEENLPIPDFRTHRDTRIVRPTPNLLDVIYHCQFRQAWLREFCLGEGLDPLGFVGSASIRDNPNTVATAIRRALGGDEERANAATWEEAMRLLVKQIEETGVTVMRSGIVGNNTHRKLDVGEFRGFCLSDAYAPLIFVNAADAVSAQMFTLAHELAHVWIGGSGVSNITFVGASDSEAFCNKVAAEVLVPTGLFTEVWNRHEATEAQLVRVARRFKVSGLVILIRAFEAGFLGDDEFRDLYGRELARGHQRRAGGGGDFYRTQGSRLGKRFISSVVSSTLEGRITYTEAFQLLGIRSSKTFNSLAETVMGGA